METDKILSADLLDIIFDGRNKEYGAYELRRTYRSRLISSLTGTAIMFLFISSYVLANRTSDSPRVLPEGIVVHIPTADPTEAPPLPKPAPKVKASAIKTTQSTVPLIVKHEVDESERPPAKEQLTDTRIALISQAGDIDEGRPAPAEQDGGRGIVSAPPEGETNYDGIFNKVEIESFYPGGAGAWMRYLNKTLRYPQAAAEVAIQGTVVLEFIVDKEGNVSNVQPIGGPTDGGLREEAVRVIRMSGKWEPAVQNGRKVKSYKQQPITFMLAAE